jgi:hypothetical protein
MRLNFSRLPAFTFALGLAAVLALFTASAHSQIAPGLGRFKTSSSTKKQTQVKSKKAEPEKLSDTIPDVTFLTEKTFESAVVGDIVTDTITIHNGSMIDLTVSSITGVDNTDFTVTGCTPNIVSSHTKDCVLTVQYKPTAAAKASFAQLTISLTAADADAAKRVSDKATADVTAKAAIAAKTNVNVADAKKAATDATATAAEAAAEIATIPAYTVELTGYPAPGCTSLPGYLAFLHHNFFPLTHTDIDDPTINCYYNTASNLAFATQVQYQYNPSGSANTVSSDLAAFQFTGGIQLALAGNASTSSCSSTATGTGVTSSTNSSCGTTGSSPSTTTATSTPTLEQDIQTLEQGGDLSLKVLYPLFNWSGHRISTQSFANPRVGFTVNGLSATTTTTNATDINFNLANENYLQIDAIPTSSGGDSPASIFGDYRWGYEHISSTYQANSNLTASNFILQQLEVGIVIGGSIKISADRYWGPSQVYVDSTGTQATANNFSNWSMRVQITPSSLAPSK